MSTTSFHCPLNTNSIEPRSSWTKTWFLYRNLNASLHTRKLSTTRFDEARHMVFANSIWVGDEIVRAVLISRGRLQEAHDSSCYTSVQRPPVVERASRSPLTAALRIDSDQSIDAPWNSADCQVSSSDVYSERPAMSQGNGSAKRWSRLLRYLCASLFPLTRPRRRQVTGWTPDRTRGSWRRPVCSGPRFNRFGNSGS